MEKVLQHFAYQPSGVCSRGIDIVIDVDKNTIHRLAFTGGCHGNLQGIGALCYGMTVPEVIERLEGIECGRRGTSCPDQLARALKEIVNREPV